MKAYTYTARQIGIKELPPGTLRLAGWEATENLKEADVFIVPCDLRNVDNKHLEALPYLKGNERRHVMFAISEQPERYLGIPAIIFRADANKGVMAHDPTTIPWPWPVEDWKKYVPLPDDGFKYDVCFVGWNSTPLTEQVCKAVQLQGNLKTLIQLNEEFYGTWETNKDTEKTEYYRTLFLNTMQKARLSLCARSIASGVVRYRFYEALSMGRIPVHFNDNGVLPFADRIDWNECSINIPEKDAGHTGEILRGWLDVHSDADIIARGLYGRAMWERWLNGKHWDRLFAECVEERLTAEAIRVS